MPERRQIDVMFPFWGLDNSVAIQSQPPYTSFDNLNVRPKDVFALRDRGGSRPGFGPSSFYDTLGSGASVRMLATVSSASRSTPTIWPEDFQGGSLGTIWSSATLWPSNTGVPSIETGLKANLSYGYSTDDLRIAKKAAPSDCDLEKRQEVCMFITPYLGTYYGTHYLAMRLSDTTPGQFTAGVLDQGIFCALTSNGTSGAFSYMLQIHDTSITVNTSGNFNFGYALPGWFSISANPLQLSGPASWHILVKFAGTTIYSNTLALGIPTGNTNIAMGFDPTTPGNRVQGTSFRHIYRPTNPSVRPQTRLVASAGGSVYVEDWPREFSGGAVPLGNVLSTSCNLSSSHQIMAAPYLQSLYIADHDDVRAIREDGTNTDRSAVVHTNRLYSDSIRQVANWTPATVMALGQFRRSTTVKTDVYEVTGLVGANTTGGVEPVWDNVVGNTTVDNDVTWTRVDLYHTDWTDHGVSPENDVVVISNGTGSIQNGTYDILYVFADYLQIYPASFGAVSGTCDFEVARSPKVLHTSPEDIYPVWESGVQMAPHQIRRAVSKTGYVYEVTAIAGTGTTGATIPFKNSDYVGLVIIDNAGANQVTWICRSMILTKWMADSGKGSVPIGNDKICLFNGRIQLSGETDGLFFASRTGDPNDWDYTLQDQGSALYSTVSEAFQIGRPITAMIPHGGDYVVYGLEDAIWMQYGDLAQGGYIRNVSRSTGIVGKRSWCFGPSGELVFLGTDGVYYLMPGSSTIQNLSKVKLPRELQGIDANYFNVVMAYDPVYDAYLTYLAADSPRPVSHFYIDRQTGAFYRVDLHGQIYPTQAIYYQSQDAASSCVIHGCYDGKIRQYRGEYWGDENTVATVYVIIGPIQSGSGGELEAVLDRLVASLPEASGPITVTIRSAPTAEGVMDAATFAVSPLPDGYRLSTGTFTAGLNKPYDVRQRGAFFAIILGSAASKQPWALESLQAVLERGGRRRI